MGYKLKKTIFLSQIASFLERPFEGQDVEILGVSAYNDLADNQLSFVKSPDLPSLAVGLIVPNEMAVSATGKFGCIKSGNPRLDFIRALAYLEETIGFSTFDFPSDIHPSVVIGPNVVVENGCVIAQGVVLEANVVIHSGTTIGEYSRVRSSSTIGGDGFGFERLADGRPIRFPHLGGVTIGENVEIGSCTAVCRGTLSNTVIENFAKIDNLVHVAHNCIIREGAFIIACAEVSGGVEVGRNAWIGPNACTIQKVSIGADALIGIGAVVTKDVEPDCVYVGNPARRLRSK